MEFKKLQKKVKHELDNAGKVFKGFSWENKTAYTYWVAQTYYFVNYSTRLLTLASAKFDVADNLLHKRYLQHAKDENGHDVLAINDLKALGLEMKSIEEFTSTSALYQSQYFWLEQKDPISFFGYILALEGLAVYYGMDALKRSSEAHGKKATSFWKVHAGEDPAHLDEAMTVLETVDPKRLDLVEKNFDLSLALYLKMLAECKAQENRDFKSLSNAA